MGVSVELMVGDRDVGYPIVSKTHKCIRIADGVAGDPDAERTPMWAINPGHGGQHVSGGVRAQTRRHNVPVPTEGGPPNFDCLFPISDSDTITSYKRSTQRAGGPSVETAPSEPLRVCSIGVHVPVGSSTVPLGSPMSTYSPTGGIINYHVFSPLARTPRQWE